MAIFFNGCLCHLIHNAAQKAGEAFNDVCNFEVEELAMDMYYWFDKSTKWKNGLLSCCTFCDQEYRATVRHETTCWLSLEIAIERILQQFASLASHFKSKDKSQARFWRLQTLFHGPITELYLLLFSVHLINIHPCQQNAAARGASGAHSAATAGVTDKHLAKAYSACHTSSSHDGTVSSIDLEMRTITSPMTSLCLVSWQSKRQDNWWRLETFQLNNMPISS